MPAYLLTGGQGRTSRPPLKKTNRAVMVDSKASAQLMSGPKPGVDLNVGTAKLRMVNRQNSAFQSPYARNTIRGAFQTARLKVGTRDSLRHNPYTTFGRGGGISRRLVELVSDGLSPAAAARVLGEIPLGQMGNIPDDRPLSDVVMANGAVIPAPDSLYLTAAEPKEPHWLLTGNQEEGATRLRWLTERIHSNGDSSKRELRYMGEIAARGGEIVINAIQAAVPRMISAGAQLAREGAADPAIRRAILYAAGYYLRPIVPPQFLIPAILAAEGLMNDPSRQQVERGLYLARPRLDPLAIEYREDL